MNDFFKDISIRGRYIYGLLCLQSVQDHIEANPLPLLLKDILYEFVESNELDIWHSKIESYIPSFVFYDYPSTDSIDQSINPEVLSYYLIASKVLLEALENLIWLGVSNLYTSFDSNLSMERLKDLTDLLWVNEIELPDPNRVSDCSIMEDHGWGKARLVQDYLIG